MGNSCSEYYCDGQSTASTSTQAVVVVPLWSLEKNHDDVDPSQKRRNGADPRRHPTTALRNASNHHHNNSTSDSPSHPKKVSFSLPHDFSKGDWAIQVQLSVDNYDDPEDDGVVIKREEEEKNDFFLGNSPPRRTGRSKPPQYYSHFPKPTTFYVHKTTILNAGKRKSDFLFRLYLESMQQQQMDRNAAAFTAAGDAVVPSSSKQLLISRMTLPHPLLVDAFQVALDYIVAGNQAVVLADLEKENNSLASPLPPAQQSPPLAIDTNNATALHVLGNVLNCKSLRTDARRFWIRDVTKYSNVHVYYQHAKLLNQIEVLDAVAHTCATNFLAIQPWSRMVTEADLEFWVEILNRMLDLSSSAAVTAPTGSPGKGVSSSMIHSGTMDKHQSRHASWILTEVFKSHRGDESLNKALFDTLTDARFLPYIHEGWALDLLELHQGFSVTGFTLDSPFDDEEKNEDVGKTSYIILATSSLQSRCIDALTEDWRGLAVCENGTDLLRRQHPVIVTEILVRALQYANEQITFIEYTDASMNPIVPNHLEKREREKKSWKRQLLCKVRNTVGSDNGKVCCPHFAKYKMRDSASTASSTSTSATVGMCDKCFLCIKPSARVLKGTEPITWSLILENMEVTRDVSLHASRLVNEVCKLHQGRIGASEFDKLTSEAVLPIIDGAVAKDFLDLLSIYQGKNVTKSMNKGNLTSLQVRCVDALARDWRRMAIPDKETIDFFRRQHATLLAELLSKSLCHAKKTGKANAVKGNK